MDLRNRRRLQALLVTAIFAVPVLVALVLTMTGWVPGGRSYGQPVRPQRDLTDVPVSTVGGDPYVWRNQDAVWTLVALPGPDCAERCLRKLDLIHRAQITLGQHADKLRLLYLGDAPDGAAAHGFDRFWTVASTPSHALDDLRATMRDSMNAILVTPDGKTLTRYATNFDPEGLRKDLKKVVH